MASNNLHTCNGCKNVDVIKQEAPAAEPDNWIENGDISLNPNVESLNGETVKVKRNDILKESINSVENDLNCRKEVSSDGEGSDGALDGNFFNIDDSTNASATARDNVVLVDNNEKILPNTTGTNNVHLSYGNLRLFDTSRLTVLRSLSDNSVVISNNNAVPQSESIASNNCSLAQLAVYASDDSTDEIVEVPKQQYRQVMELDSEKGSESDSSSSSSSSSIVISSDSSDEDDEEVQGNKKECAKLTRCIRGKQELELQDLPPIEELEINVPEEQCIPVGKVFQIVDRLVVVQSLKGVPAYDLDTVLFTQAGQPLGKIFDVLGPVSEPYYCIRFNSRGHIDEKNISLGQEVYSAPETKHTNFVFLSQLMQFKGSDASWKHDLEPPANCLDYSDDEQESVARKKGQRNRKDKPSPGAGSDPDEPARKRHFAYEKKMNRRNLRMTADRSQCRGSNTWGNVRRPDVPMFNAFRSNFPSPSSFRGFCNQMFGKPPTFGPGVAAPPPPAFGSHHPPEACVSPLEMIQTPFNRGNSSDPVQARFTIPDVYGPPPMTSFCRIPGPGFSSPEFIRTPPPSPDRSHMFRPYPPRPAVNNRYQFPPWPVRPSDRLPFPDPVGSPQMNFPPPPPPPARAATGGTGGPLLSSPLWIQKPPALNFSPMAVPHRPERPEPPRPFWPTPAAPSVSIAMTDFNPHMPPPPPPGFNHNAVRFNHN